MLNVLETFHGHDFAVAGHRASTERGTVRGVHGGGGVCVCVVMSSYVVVVV